MRLRTKTSNVDNDVETNPFQRFQKLVFSLDSIYSFIKIQFQFVFSTTFISFLFFYEEFFFLSSSTRLLNIIIVLSKVPEYFNLNEFRPIRIKEIRMSFSMSIRLTTNKGDLHVLLCEYQANNTKQGI